MYCIICLLLFSCFIVEFHLHDRGKLRTSDMLHYHHHAEILHHSWVCAPVWKFTDRSPVVWCHVCLRWTYPRQYLRKSKEKSVET